jgi:transmembrane 9 superfamily protein 2/4
MRVSAARLLLQGAILADVSSGFYLPGVAPKDYLPGEKVEIKVNKLTSTKTQLPYEYYMLPFCQPDTLETVAENLGEVLRGDKIMNSHYDLKMGVEETCKILCRKELTGAEAKQFSVHIEEDYRVHWVMDNLPSATKYVDETNPAKPITIYDLGFPLGFRGSADIPGTKEGVSYLNNHLLLTIKYHRDDSFEGSRIVGFEVEPSSVKHAYAGQWKGATTALTTCGGSASAVPLSMADGGEVVFTYDVKWEASEIKWASRWDTYLLMGDEQIHWFSIVNSLMIVLFLTGMVAMIMMRTLHRDFNKYNSAEVAEEVEEETGWKLVHGDVFRPPAYPMMLSVLVGTGVQTLTMSMVTMTFAVLGFLSPANRGGLMTAALLLFVFMGVPAGYSSAFLHKTLKGLDWKRNIILTSCLLPGVVALTSFVLNFFVWGERSTSAVPFGTMFALLVLWLGISVPLVFLGAYFGYRRKAVDFPVRINQIPRQVPEQVWYMQPTFSIVVGGVLPFGAVFIELFFILSSIWLHQFYYVFGFLLLVFLILIVTCAEISIVMCYFQLCAEDYHWWWRSFLTAGSSAAYMFAYSIFYFFTKLEITKPVSAILYFANMGLAALMFFLLTGTIGFYSCYYFVFKIFSSIKVD